MINVTEARKGITIELDGTLYEVLDYEHIKMARGSAQVRLKLRDVRGGHTIDRTFQATAKFPRARVERQPVQFLYRDGDLFYFMNTQTYDQTPLNRSQVGDAANYLAENATCDLLAYGDEPIGIELPAAVVLTVAETEPWVKGDTAQGGTKPARLETGLVVKNVPLFINIGDRLKIDTRSGAYLERA
ncbi:MAG: elongation factor P [Chloroflexi bacterium RBG_16_68_14]|nr:MAG: elongation factor P [Chloroflexi bacterium RBG_16_68_14]